MKKGQPHYQCPWCGTVNAALMGGNELAPPLSCSKCREPFNLEVHHGNGYCTECGNRTTPLVFTVWCNPWQRRYVKSACPSCFVRFSSVVQKRLLTSYSWMYDRFECALVKQNEGQPIPSGVQ